MFPFGGAGLLVTPFWRFQVTLNVLKRSPTLEPQKESFVDAIQNLLFNHLQSHLDGQIFPQLIKSRLLVQYTCLLANWVELS